MDFPPQKVQVLVNKIAEILKKRKETLAVSESSILISNKACGGLISSYLVSVPGASEYFVGGTLTYALRSRLKLSGWSENDVLSYTGPSEDVALRLARNLKLELGSTYALSETGWAGPTGDMVGSVYFGLASPQGTFSEEKHVNIPNRPQIMAEFAYLALQMLATHLESLDS